MRWQVLLYSTALLALIAAAALQHSELVTMFGIKPNILLALMAVFVFFVTDLAAYLLLLLVAGVLIRFSPGLGIEAIGLTLVGLLFFYIRRRFFSPGTVAIVLITALGTVVFYLLLSPALMYDNLVLTIGEIAYNVILAALLFGLTSILYEKKGGSPIR